MNEDFLKLTAITYQLLELWGENDLLKIKAQEKVLNIQEKIKFFYNSSEQILKKERIKKEIEQEIETLLDYLKLGKIQGRVNPHNYLILCNEYKKIKEMIIPQENSTNLLLKKREEKDETEVKSRNFKKEQKGRKFQEDKKLNDRQKIIIDFLKNNQKGAVRDFQKILPSITKRTIRRDLDKLLKLGKIKRRGKFNEVFYEIIDENKRENIKEVEPSEIPNIQDLSETGLFTN